MKKYNDYKKDNSKRDLSKDEINSVEWTKYKIIVPTEKDRQELMEAFEHIHYSDIDTEFVSVNQLAHEYLDNKRIDNTWNNIIVDENLYKSIESKKGISK
jgi:hypothetical protein